MATAGLYNLLILDDTNQDSYLIKNKYRAKKVKKYRKMK